MRWQRVAQAAIAIFVIGFTAFLAMTLRRQGGSTVAPTQPPRAAPDAPVENPDGGKQQVTDPSGKERWKAEFGRHVSLADGRQQLSGNVTATINRGDRQFIVRSREADITPAPDGVKDAVFRGNVRITGSGGLEVRGEEARYTQADGIMTMPGAVAFTKGRTTGSGTHATYDQQREVLWIRENARVDAPPAADGSGALHATAGAIGIARADHYIRLERNGRIEGDNRIAEADEITIRLTDDDERVRALELRGRSRIIGTSGPLKEMTARDIDMAYGADGRTLQQVRLVENAVAQLTGAGGGAGQRIAAATIDMGLGPDGTTLTNLSANDRVQLDLPPEATEPAKRIESQTLTATGAAAGLQNATFGGGVVYRESRAARRNLPAVDRTARSQTLIAETKPGLGAIQKADFRGTVRFTDAPDFVAEAQQGIYDIARDRLDLLSMDGQPGVASPTVTDGNVTVAARTIQFGLASREMTADTKVRSTIRQTAKAGEAGKAPSMLAKDEPVNVTANRLTYKGRNSAATYTGNVTLWQGEDTTIKGASITIDDKSGNLAASGGVTTSFPVEDTGAKKGPARQTTLGSAETFTYDDAKRLATYSVKANIRGPQGDLSGEKIELFLRKDSNSLQRAEAYGANGAVQVREGKRIAKGSHLTYTADDEQYLMIGAPVEIVEEKDGVCTETVGATARFNRVTEGASVEGATGGNIPMAARTLKACPAGLGR